jgi:hypothetical protein
MPGIAVTAAALVVMPLLATWKRRLGHELDNEALLADATETLLCLALRLESIGGLCRPNRNKAFRSIAGPQFHSGLSRRGESQQPSPHRRLSDRL